MALRINVGCGQNPTSGWRNFDNSPSLRLATLPAIPGILRSLGLIGAAEQKFIDFANKNRIEFGDAAKGLPVPDGSAEVLYTSHMVEHLDATERDAFLAEAMRVLCPGGILRIAVPDISVHVAKYLQDRDADAFIERTHLTVPRARSLGQRFRLLMVGTRHHQWMYDGSSLCAVLRANGFVNVEALPAGTTHIQNPEPLNLSERVSESLYVEAEKPKA